MVHLYAFTVMYIVLEKGKFLYGEMEHALYVQ